MGSQEGIRAWSALNRSNSLPEILRVDPSKIIESTELQQVAIDEYRKYTELTNLIRLQKAQCHNLKLMLDNAIQMAENELKDLLPCAFWIGFVGELSVRFFFVTETDSDSDLIFSEKYYTKIANTLIKTLSASGYQLKNSDEKWLSIYSEEQCKREANGNWYYFFK